MGKPPPILCRNPGGNLLRVMNGYSSRSEVLTGIPVTPEAIPAAAGLSGTPPRTPPEEPRAARRARWSVQDEVKL